MDTHLLGIDIGSSFVKVCLLNASAGKTTASATEPANEMEMISRQPGWAEQNQEIWWQYVIAATRKVLNESGVAPSSVVAIGISYQMHGLVIVDRNQKVLRPAIIWCDSRAVEIGEKAAVTLGDDYVLGNLLNSPGNFTASKLKWVQENEPEVYRRTYKAMLPGDYIAMRLTGEVTTTASGLSEGIMWDFKAQKASERLLNHLGIDASLIADTVPTFGTQGKLNKVAAGKLGLAEGTPICYRAGDQPNNAFSLNTLNPGEVAATAGTSGVVYAVVDEMIADPESRVNTFLHVNHKADLQRLGVLLCVNGAGIMNSRLRKELGRETTYDAMNVLAAQVPTGSDQLVYLPFGNGAERMLGNRNLGASFHNRDAVRHQPPHLCRAVQEGIAFAMGYGFEILRELGIVPKVILAGNANMFQSPVFCETFAQATGTELQLFNVDGAQGAARGAGIGSGCYKDMQEAFHHLKCLRSFEPIENGEVVTAFNLWKQVLKTQLEKGLS